MTVLDRNWRCREGEIDIVARDGDVLVVCEVKTRRGTGFGHPLEAVTAAQAAPAAPAGRAWLAAHDVHAPRRAVRRGRRAACRRDGAAAGRARAGGVLSDAGPHLVGRRWSASTGAWSRSRPTSAPGVPGVTPGRPAGRRRCGVARPGPGGGGQHRRSAGPHRRITVGLSPAALPKHGQRLRPRARRGGARGGRARCRARAVDDAGAARRARPRRPVRPVRGVLPAVLAARPGRASAGGGPGGQRRRGGAGRRASRCSGVGTLRRAGRRACAGGAGCWRRPTPRPRRRRPPPGAATSPTSSGQAAGRAGRSRSPRPAGTTCC